MLYKKYHKNYIRQFKLGTKIRLGFECGKITEEPSLSGPLSGKDYIQIRLDVVPICREDTGYRAIFTICDNTGKLPTNEWIQFV